MLGVVAGRPGLLLRPQVAPLDAGEAPVAEALVAGVVFDLAALAHPPRHHASVGVALPLRRQAIRRFEHRGPAIAIAFVAPIPGLARTVVAVDQLAYAPDCVPTDQNARAQRSLHRDQAPIAIAMHL